MIINIGDMLSNSTGINAIFYGYLESQLKAAYRKPILNFRGNHEFVGCSPGTFYDVWGTPDFKRCSLHRFGDVCIIGIDAWSGITGAEMDVFLKDMKQIAQNPAFLTAAHRIVVAHYPAGWSSHASKKIMQIIAPIAHKTDLFLAGHIHKGYISRAGSGIIQYFDGTPDKKVPAFPFTLIVNEGPRIRCDNTFMLVEAKGKSLDVALYWNNGSLFKKFSIK